MERIGLLLGSFNPVHRAHVALGVWALDRVDRVWVVPSPGNPLKGHEDLAPWADRVAMVELAFSGVDRVEVCGVERELPAPHYTIQTIEHLQKIYPDKEFTIVCGSDIARELPRWHRSEELERMVSFLVYPRGEGLVEEWVESSTAIRNGELVDGLDPLVGDYIDSHELYYASALHLAQAAFAAGRFGEVLNLSVRHPDNVRLLALASMARDVLCFRHIDFYNP